MLRARKLRAQLLACETGEQRRLIFTNPFNGSRIRIASIAFFCFAFSEFVLIS
jgi:hypothetical protein